MSNTIRTYDELVKKRRNLEVLLEAQEQLIRLEYNELKAQLEPIQDVLSTFFDFVTRDKKAWILNESFSLIIDKLVKDVLLANTGWLTKFIIPELIKNYSSHQLAVLQEKLVTEISAWLEGKTDEPHEEIYSGDPALN